ncbi:hypothetical protein NMU03_13865 [Allocoprobacillus halotolerans]|uniref:ParB/Sulfiredoxin domain-containing protein n=1 Tax=Allocoprobacillus halotolerans TaxID=2944914 RepID=A0ABY5I3R3_9FIRM|nr:ParB N-terminal domain-containing protein [Allocoprobacillus halotolerans]UTY38683.1 hypothetical protein NMU03_13865 [Allocoprobacillus halotolerans]
MRINKIDIADIHFDYQKYPQTLYQSILRIGFSFPITINQEEQYYECIDGHKRLSVLHDILKDNPQYKRGSLVPVIIKNNGNVRSNDCWKGRNSH